MKKIFALVLALCMLTACVFAEEAVNSKSAGKGTVVTDTTEEAGEEGESVVELEDAPEEVLALFENSEFPIKVFTETTELAVEALIGEDGENLGLIELNKFNIIADNYVGGDLDVELSYDEDFAQFKNVVSIIKAGDEELPYLMETNEEGNLTFTMPEEDVQKVMNAEEAFIAILAD